VAAVGASRVRVAAGEVTIAKVRVEPLYI